MAGNRTVKRECIDCHKIELIHGHDRCNICYQIFNRAKRKEKAGKILCADGCGEWIDAVTTEGKPQMYKPGHNLPKDAIGEKHPCWKGGIYIDKKDGYIYKKMYYHPFKTRNGQVAVHRLVYEHYLKILFDEDIYIPREIEIDHIDGNVQNNALINLRPLTKSQHGSISSIKRWNDIKIRHQ
jgi:hypothetical protein